MSAEIADEIEQQILPELQNAIVRAEVWGDYGTALPSPGEVAGRREPPARGLKSKGGPGVVGSGTATPQEIETR